MAGRPTSSRGSARPSTAGGRPSTSTGVFNRDPRYTFSPEYGFDEEEEEEEESDDEDVFAFLPPSTAEQQAQQQLQQQQQQHAYPQVADLSQQPTLAYPHDPYTPFSSDSHFNAINQSSSHYTTDITQAHLRVETPSTSSHNGSQDPDGAHRLRRINPAPSTAEADESREVVVSLPPSREQQQHKLDVESAPGTGFSKNDDPESSIAESFSIHPDDDSIASIKMEFDFDAIEEEDSPFPEVRASVSNIDDPEMPAMTARMWFIGLILCMCSSAANVFFNFRSPAPSIVPLALLLLAYPVGKLFAFSLPITIYRIPIPRIPYFTARFSYPPALEFSLNPGPWNIKEHVLVFIMANVAVSPPYAINAIVVSEVFYNIRLGYWFNLTLILATQLTGFGLAGLCRRFLVWPASMVWPQNLVACTLLNTLHAEEDSSSGGITRYKFFMIATGSSFLYFFLPGFLFKALSVFSFICWIAPNNIPVNQLFGVSSGLGMSLLTFDWAQISWIGSPLMVPWWAEVHVFVGFVLFFWILTPALYYSNTWSLAYLPISDNNPYDKYGNVYDYLRVLKADKTFNSTAYEEYSPLFLPATYAVTYLLAFALSTCVIVHTVLYHGRSLLNGIQKIKIEADDVHAKLMRHYPEVPDWWYATSFVFFFCIGIIAVEVWHTGVPVWALLVSVLLAVVYVLPSGFIYALTGQGISLNLLAQILPGVMLPGNPLANMVFKAYSVQTLAEALMFIQDLKLGHYIKVPPRATFMVQAVATILAAFVQCGVKQWMFDNVHNICDSSQSSSLTCPHNQVYFTASAIWGLIGPSRQFGSGTLYNPLLYAMVAGAVLPIPFWLWQRRFPTSWIKSVNTPVILTGVQNIPPATGINYSAWFAVGFIFQYLIRRRNFAWWSRFNYVTSAALDAGTVLSGIFIFFTLQFPKGGRISVEWWGNNVFKNTADYNQTPLRTPPEGGFLQ